MAGNTVSSVDGRIPPTPTACVCLYDRRRSISLFYFLVTPPPVHTHRSAFFLCTQSLAAVLTCYVFTVWQRRLEFTLVQSRLQCSRFNAHRCVGWTYVPRVNAWPNVCVICVHDDQGDDRARLPAGIKHLEKGGCQVVAKRDLTSYFVAYERIPSVRDRKTLKRFYFFQLF